MQMDSRKPAADDVVQIGNVNMVVKDVGKQTMVFGKSVNSSIQKPIMANDQEVSSSSTDKYSQHRWCPPGLNHTQKRRSQCLRH